MNNDRACPVCKSDSASASLYLEENIQKERITSLSYASRKLPEFMCHKLLKCSICSVVYAANPPSESALAQAYHASAFDSAREAEDAARTYERSVQPLLDVLPEKKAALEIGAGTGIFLEILKERGFETVLGVEPSSAAIASAPPHRRAWIREAIFRETDFEPCSFDFICCFMTLEHVRNPEEVVLAMRRLLKPGGAIAIVTHNYKSMVNRVLGKRSPIIDIEHMQLFSPAAMTYLLRSSGFEIAHTRAISNRYCLSYWMRLLPIGDSAKMFVLRALDDIGISDIKISINVGNMLTTARLSDS